MNFRIKGEGVLKKDEELRIVFISYVIIIFGVIALEYFEVDILKFKGLLKALKISTLLTAWWGFYFKYGWKIPYLNKMLYKKNLNGTWFGTYQSKDIETKAEYNGEIALKIKQDFLNIGIVSYTQNYTNYSYSEILKYKDESDLHELIYVYSQKTHGKIDLNMRSGTSELELKKIDGECKLIGKFWTIHGSVGELDLKMVSKKKVDSFEDARLLFKDGE